MDSRAPNTPYIGFLGAFDLTHIVHIRMLHGGLKYVLKNNTLEEDNNSTVSSLLWPGHVNTFRRQSINNIARLMTKDVLIAEIMRFFLDVDGNNDVALLDAAGQLREFVDDLIYHKINFEDSRSEESKNSWVHLARRWCERHPLYIPVMLSPLTKSNDVAGARITRSASPDYDPKFEGVLEEALENARQDIIRASQAPHVTRSMASRILAFTAGSSDPEAARLESRALAWNARHDRQWRTRSALRNTSQGVARKSS